MGHLSNDPSEDIIDDVNFMYRSNLKKGFTSIFDLIAF